MIPLFECLYPDAIAEFIFDQSSAHGAFSKDALNAKDMNVRPGGKQRTMHDTCIPSDNPKPELRGKAQPMVFSKDLPPGHPDYEFRGQPKGMQRILEERGLLTVLHTANNGRVVGECQRCKLSREAQEQLRREALAAMEHGEEPSELHADIVSESLSATCCMRKMLANQQDFKAEKPLIQTIIEGAGHKCWFLPKFHCELNPIEMYWGWVKARESTNSWPCDILTSRRDCDITGFRIASDGKFPTAKHLIPEILNACPTKTIRAFFCKSWRYMDAYMYDSQHHSESS